MIHFDGPFQLLNLAGTLVMYMSTSIAEGIS